MTKGKSKRIAKEIVPTRTAQHCAQCTAHGRISLLKGHKKVCPFKECQCVHCILVNNKRQIMAKQVKLKRLQEKNHSRQRRMSGRNTSLREAMENSSDKKPDPEISEMQHYQEEAWRAICSQNVDLEQALHTQVPKYMPSDQWCSTVSPYTHPNHLQQLQSTTNPALLLQPCYPVTSSATTLNFFTTPIGEPGVLPINHVLTQPVFCQCVPPSYGQNTTPTNQFPMSFPNESYLQPGIEVPPGSAQSIDAAEALLTLRIGEE